MREKYLLYLRPPPSFKESWRYLLKMNCGHLMRNIQQRFSYLMGFIYPRFLFHRAEKYNQRREGISHSTHNLNCLLKEASCLGRTAIVMPMSLNEMHNFGKLMDGAVDKYYDLEKSYFYTPASEKTTDAIKGEGKEHVDSISHLYADHFLMRRDETVDRTKRKLDYILLEDFIRTSGSFGQVRFFPCSASIPEEENKRWRIIVKYLNRSSIASPHRLSHKTYRAFFDTTHLHLEYVGKLARLAEKISSRLKGREEKYYFLRIRMTWDEHNPFDEERAQQGIRQELRDVMRPFYSAEGLCRKVAEFFPPGSVLYIASNLWGPYDQEYFSHLKRLYKVYRYYDFPDLTPFVEGPAPNTARLSLVENMLRDRSVENLLIHWHRGVYLSNRRIC